jgi:alkyl hydroperoxide reductase subunit AhpC
LFSHPKDFTTVCTTEPGYMAGLEPEFAKRKCKIIFGDPELKVAKLYKHGAGGRRRYF